MKANELQKELKQIGISVPLGTLGRWAHEGLVAGPRRYTERGKRGHFADWPEESLEETAACWVVRNDQVGGPPAKEYIQGIREAAHVLLHTPWEYCVIEQPPHQFFGAAQTHADRFWTHQNSDYVAPVETNDFQYASFRPDDRIAKWMAAEEKARRRISIETGTVIAYDWIIDWQGRDADKALYDNQEPTYHRNDVHFRITSAASSEAPSHRDMWETAETRPFHDEIRIFFRVPEFTENLLDLVK